MTAQAHSPHFADGWPITPTSRTPGCAYSTSSTSAGYTFSPPEMIMSFERSLM